MRRSISYCEPNYALAGKVNTWTFIFTPATNLPKGARLKFDFGSKGRDIDWEIPSINPKDSSNVIYGLMDNGKALSPVEVENPDAFTPFYEFTLPSTLEAGKNFTIIVGSPPNSKVKNPEKTGNRAQCNSQRRRTFFLHVDPTGKGRYEEPEIFTMDVRGSELKTISILSPSFVTRNKRFDVIVRFEDQYGNLTSNAPDETMIELSHEHLRENLKWTLFVPETGFINLPNLYFNEPGIYTIQLLNTHTKEVFCSPPIKCFSENSRHLFWGLLHGESERIDSTENIENCLRHIRDDKAMNFYATSPFENAEETPNETWRLITQNVAEFDEIDRFVTFLGFQWSGEPAVEGSRILLWTKDNKPIMRIKDPKYTTLSKIYKSCSPKELISIPSFTMAKGHSYNFAEYEPEFERVVEIYNAWGSSENTKKAGNPRPITCTGKNGIQETAEGAIQTALQHNCRFGFVSGGLDDRGIYSDLFETTQEQYSPGMTAIISAEHSRTALAEALHNRSCYATTGERIIVGLYLAGSPMGTELSTATKPGLMVNRHLSGYVAGTTNLKSVELIRNGEVLHSFKIKNYSLDFVYDDMVPFEEIAINNKDKKPPFIYYYLRIIQEDGHMAWSSPIWVDLLPPIKDLKKGKLVKPSAPTKLLEDFNEEEEDVEEDEDEDEGSEVEDTEGFDDEEDE